MAPVKSSRKSSSANKGNKGTNKPHASSAKKTISKRPKPAPPVQQKSSSKPGPLKKKRKVYTDKELGIPKLNTIMPVGVDLPKGKKKGKVFVDDQESMMTILAIVNASKEGEIESKMMKSRHMEEVREARRREAEAREEQKNSKLDDTKDSLRRKRKRKSNIDPGEATTKEQDIEHKSNAGRKRVSFA